VNQDEVESQLSAMFDGELPAAECELLSRRIDRDDNLRGRWARYALIGAAMRSEPVATARSGFAGRVSAALEASSRPRRLRRRPKMLWNGALAATLVAGVAGLGVSMLRTAALGTGGLTMAAAPASRTAVLSDTVTPVVAGIAGPGAAAAPIPAMSSEPGSYVTPSGNALAPTMLRTRLADFIVAHSYYSVPLLRRNVLTELMTSEDQIGIAVGSAGAAGDTPDRSAGGGNASRPVSDISH
jgi:negative regulator of sigma E activity